MSRRRSPPPARRRRPPRRAGLVLSALAALGLMLAYAGVWHWQADRLRATLVERLAAVDGRAGVTLANGPVAVGGFPFRLVLSVPDLTLDLSGDGLRARLALGRVEAVSHLWTPDHWVVRGADVAGHGAFADGPALALQAAAVRASLTERDTAGWRLGLEVPALALGPPGAAPALVLDRALLVVDGAEATETQGVRLPRTGRLALRAERARLVGGDAPAAGPLGRTIEAPALRVALHGVLGGVGRADLADWRDAGGTLELDRLSGDWGGVAASVNGSLALDEAFRPFGAATLVVDDPSALIGQAAALGMVPADVARSVSAATAGATPARLAMMVQDGVLTLGPVALATLPPLLAPR
ncbi:hypothetical protein EV659_103360 [Rhodothalassium salexigens DSM 2132]|uniref:DUF2125 domain-containing protein n=1 Tax=Rhodothalassium salexigens DSM 2132 TaxID=1188247 RepID=A0A4R2PNW2_RHOSA|nr:hypothetical protein [Rhodothalassium salexigens DSM 2132]TCP36468.1 hypothetical protein EV659_103360 [Rhodothalassium salexigens DSM 2132]